MSAHSTYTDSTSFGGYRITWAVQRLIFVFIIVFAVQLALTPVQVLVFDGRLTLENLFSFNPVLFFHGHVWRAFTYQFLHGGLMHLFMNMLWLYFFGPDVERVLGTRGFFRFFLICGSVAVLATCLPYVLNDSMPFVVGASGGVMAVLVAYAMIDPQRQLYFFPIPFPITAVAMVGIIAALNVIQALQDNPISVATHFGGMGMGFLYMKCLPQVNAWSRRRRRPQGAGKKSKLDKIGEEVDNIFKFNDPNRR